MRKRVNSIYCITRNTKAIMAKDSHYYRSVILEVGQERERSSVHNIEEILEHSCLVNGASLDGRRTSIKKFFQIHSKIPVIVSLVDNIYMIPTSSTKNKDCVLLSYSHIKYYEQRDDRTYIHFRDGTGIYVKASRTSIDMQFKRASQIIAALKVQGFFDETMI